jgi:ankyrin repeat protein
MVLQIHNVHVIIVVVLNFIYRVLSSGANRLLMAASEGDNESVLKLVEEEGVSPSHELSHGITPLHEACEGGHVKTTELLIELGADVNKQVTGTLSSQ